MVLPPKRIIWRQKFRRLKWIKVYIYKKRFIMRVYIVSSTGEVPSLANSETDTKLPLFSPSSRRAWWPASLMLNLIFCLFAYAPILYNSVFNDLQVWVFLPQCYTSTKWLIKPSGGWRLDRSSQLLGHRAGLSGLQWTALVQELPLPRERGLGTSDIRSPWFLAFSPLLCSPHL